MYIVDDDPFVLRALGRLLEVHGYETRRFASASELLAAGLPAPDACLITDVIMPDMDGLQLCAELRRRGCLTPTIVITAVDKTETRESAERMGCAAFLHKPIEAPVLLDAVAQAMAMGGRRTVQ